MIKRLDNENEAQFLWRLGQAKDNGIEDLSWNDIADIMNKEFRDDVTEYLSEAAYRKPYQQAKRFFESGVFDNFTDDKYLEIIREAEKSARIERFKLFDERTARRKNERSEARREVLLDSFKRIIKEHQPIRLNYEPIHIEHSNNDMIIHLTDIHYGVYVDSVFNKCSGEIIKERLTKFLYEIDEAVNLYHPEKAYVILGGDTVHGLIHQNGRIESNENVLSQVVKAADLICDFLYELSKKFSVVEVHTTAGNHGRLNPKKDNNALGENLDLLIPEFGRRTLQNIKNVIFVDNIMSYDIATFTVRGWNVYATHGDKDNRNTIVNNMTDFARKVGAPLPDICYLGHRHTNGYSTSHNVKVIESGCVDGMDNYAIDMRLVGMPEQTITIVTEKSKIKALIDVQLYC